MNPDAETEENINKEENIFNFENLFSLNKIVEIIRKQNIVKPKSVGSGAQEEKPRFVPSSTYLEFTNIALIVQ